MQTRAEDEARRELLRSPSDGDGDTIQPEGGGGEGHVAEPGRRGRGGADSASYGSDSGSGSGGGGGGGGGRESSTAQPMYTWWETARASAVVFPVWFVAQYTFNLSLSLTSVTVRRP